MQLVFIHGAPAVGKLTVARELAALTGFRLFHNHLTVDLAGSVFSASFPALNPWRMPWIYQLLESYGLIRY